MYDNAPLDAGDMTFPDVIPDWVFEDAPPPDPPFCECGRPVFPEPAAEPAAEWATPGVTDVRPFGEGETLAELPPVSAAVAQLQALTAALAEQSSTELPSAQALADSEALLEVEQQLRVLNLGCVGDVAARGLHELVGFRSAKSWLRAHRPDGDAQDAKLAQQLRAYPALQAAVADGRVPLAAARKVALALAKLCTSLDRADGLIDGQPGDEVLPAVVRHVLKLVCRNLLGVADDDPRLQVLVERALALLEAPSQLAVVEGALAWLAEEIPARLLNGPIDEIVLALLPSELEERDEKGRRRRGLTITPLEDGSGWHLCGDLSLEAGERLFVALRAEAARDTRNPADTEAWEQARANGDADLWALGADVTGPRGRRERLHDAFNALLARYLEHGLGGVSKKRPVQVSVVIDEATVSGRPGAPPPRGASGRLIPRGVVRRWWCDSTVTAYVFSLGGKALRAVHSQRTMTADEETAFAIEGGARCAGDGCCPNAPDVLTPVRAHHTNGYAESKATCIDEMLPVCDTLHHDIHDGGRTVRLRDGRYLNESGFVEAPPLFADAPPF